MSEVHQAITAHSNKQHALVKQFLQLDAKRERYIEEAVHHCQNGQPFTVENINEVTKQINELARQGIVPQRKYVTVDMVKEYVERLKKKGEK
ncbi:YpbS family protein [Anoxybacteroides tepidamans]|uniref:YpbS family protein n=1 Tax=Anoxybacteroides tepidamans TaxID=265948 RepID=UPI000488C770|nr:YpbS family protein [Anoxybacillus tepidamans]